MIRQIDSIVKGDIKYKFIDSIIHKQLQNVAEQIGSYTDDLSNRIFDEVDFISNTQDFMINSYITTNIIENNEYELVINIQK